ncbi:hypothetical protein [Streptomyces sp. NPDC051576]|uniref:hypothetical protein n=1 Tax=Streptomyces sp. NPDC051576 TaxID=3155803 RepID=UPI00343DF086
MSNADIAQTLAESGAARAGASAGQPTADARARVERAVLQMHLAWGVAWFIGFGLLFLHDGPDSRTFVSMPAWLPITTLMVLLVVAGVVTFVVGARAFSRDAVGELIAQQARRYGAAWLLGFVGLILTIGKITSDLPDETKGLLWGATTTGLVGVLHIAGSALWGDRSRLRWGIWVTFINVVGVMAGQGWQDLIICVAGGALSLILGGRQWTQSRSSS